MFELSRMVGEMSPAKRWSLFAGLLLILAAAVGTGWALLRAPYAVLFSDMKEQDAAILAQELDKLKVPYQVAAGGRTLLVPESAVHKTRMTLMGKQLPLNGAMGFELFNNAEFGVSDFVQKVNYQRALQGELTRTILSIEQIQSVRVHLALPEQGLFRKESHKAKASVTVIPKPGQALMPSQVLGIQRLVSASVPEVKSEDVTVIDQQGVTLSKPVNDAAAASVSPDQLEAKVSLEGLLASKAVKVLDGMFGDGNALVTVDALLNHQLIRTTTEEVLPALGQGKGATPAGVVTRERSVTRDGPSGDASRVAATTSQDIDYQTGKRVEQVTAPAGAVTRLNVAVVVKHALSNEDVQRVKEVVAAAVGLQAARGDAISVYSMANPQQLPQSVAAEKPSAEPVDVPAPAAPAPIANAEQGIGTTTLLAGGIGLCVALLLIVIVVWRRKRVRPAVMPALPMTDAEREAVLRSVQRWLAAPGVRVDV